MLKNVDGRIYGYREDTGEWYDAATYEKVKSPVSTRGQKTKQSDSDASSEPMGAINFSTV